MSRTAMLATGFFLIMMGIQLHVVESFTMTPRVAHFLRDSFNQDEALKATSPSQPLALGTANPNYQSAYYQPGFDTSRGIPTIQASASSIARPPINGRVAPPNWICWPVLFLGAFLLIQGITQPR